MKRLNVSTLGFLGFLLALGAGLALVVVGLDALRSGAPGAPCTDSATRGALRAVPGEDAARTRAPERAPERAPPERKATSLVFEVDVPQARSEGRITDAQDAQVMADTLGVLRKRLDAAGFATFALEDLGDGRFEILVPSEREADVERVTALATTMGDLQLRIEVLPDGRYAADAGGSTYVRARSRVWPGTEEEFEAFKEAEVTAWREARSAGVAYVPTRKPFRVVPTKGVDPEVGVRAFRVVEDLEASQRFDGSILEHPDVSRGHRGEPVTVFGVRREHRAAFSAWTERNVRLPMAILMNGECLVAPTISSPLSDSVEVALGPVTWAEAKRQAEELKLALQLGALVVRPTLVARSRVDLGPAQPPR